ncbi:MAG: corrinoid protein [Dehalococcoidales bacterium]|jgi:5-methyltetrahydrofolate--homocysteine methyltransferase|nr:corrinoid protein [Dehalococcoidales bacterium]|tara:strand:- start:251 stop:886 length:636 start_codon:yes stop_codon:yes gene_type:complete
MVDVKTFHQAMRELDTSAVDGLVQAALQQDTPAETILNEGLIAAMSIVGRHFRAKEIWVPDVLLAAQNMHSGISILKPILRRSQSINKGTLVIGTIEGDIHDIGKNIVSVLMEGSGFEIIDLGVNVPAKIFLEAVEKHHPDILGLSAMLTTTMQEMKNVIGTVRKSTGDKVPKLIVGGAPVTREFANEIGADDYGEDAISGVEIALKLLGK